ncbi:MAG: hypothetical protein AAGM38_02080 [Pseudomonadota bacterium]
MASQRGATRRSYRGLGLAGLIAALIAAALAAGLAAIWLVMGPALRPPSPSRAPLSFADGALSEATLAEAAAASGVIARIEAARRRARQASLAEAPAAPERSDPAAGFAFLSPWRAPKPLRLALGPNQDYAPHFAEAARRSGLSAAAIAALIDAEAAKTASGAWDPRSGNTRSTARGLGQFLQATWLAEAAKRHRLLNQEARARGLLDARGRPKSATAEAALLALRDDPRLSIIAAAEMAAEHVLRLAAAGHAAGGEAEAARLAYLAHHAGYTGARAHLRGERDAARAAVRLRANLTDAQASKWLDAHKGAPAEAYAAWLDSYVAERVAPQRFAPLAPAGLE